ncbi:hypothetical protein DV736_g1809, partial [Chaetothyriales sp. CBS 134916]
MAVAVFISHNGQLLFYERPDVDLDAFRQWIESEAAIPPSRQILMNSRGRNVKNLKNESEIFVYDKKTLFSDAQPPPDRSDSLPEVPRAATEPADPGRADSWKELFGQQRQWALNIVDAVRNGAERVEAVTLEADAISRSIATALENLNNYVDNLAKKFEATQQWATDFLSEQKESLRDWESSRRVLLEVPIREDLGHILSRAASRSQQINTLGDLADEESLHSAEASLKVSSADFEYQLGRLISDVSHVKQETGALRRHIVQVQDAGVDALVQEAETVAQPIVRDHDELLKVGDGNKAVSIASRKNATHVSELIPGLEAVVADLRHAYSDCLQTRNEAARACFAALTEISGIQSKLSRLQADICKLEFKDEASLHTLGQVFQLPSVYGCSLVEAARRSEWAQRMQTDVDTMHDDLAQLTDEEQRRRKKWNTSYAKFLKDDPDASAALIDLQASKPRNTWPLVDRSEVFTYLDDLRALTIDDAVKTITQRLKDLDAPTRRKANVFNSGSVHDLASSSVVKNGDDLRAVQEQKHRLEEKLKASESRVRKLEDVLHRQSQLARPPSSTFSGGFSDFDARTMSPVPFAKQTDFTSRPSISLRRASGASDEKAAVNKILALEAEVQQLKEDAHAERQSSAEHREKMIEAESVKHDLMANMDAQKQEFEDERQLLDDENHKLKIRIEELEDELDRVLGSKEHFKLTKEEQIDYLKHELSEEKQLSAERIRHTERKADEGLAALRERAATLERQANQHREERNSARDKNVNLATRLRSHEEQQQDLTIALQNAHTNLSPAGSPPDDLKRLANALEILCEGAAIHARGLDDSLQLATAEKRSLEERIEMLQREKDELEERLETSRGQHHMAEEMMKMARSNETGAREEIRTIQQELNDLREKLAAGESGSGALRDKLLSEQHRVEELANVKLENERTIQELRVEADTASKEAEESAVQIEKLKSKLRSRGEKAQRLSERLYQHNDRVIRMLEQFGYSITRQDDTLVIQRVSKVSSVSTMLSGGEELGSALMKRTVSGGVPTPHYSDPKDLETLYWMSDTEGDEDIKYHDFLTAIQRLQLDSTMEMIAKRYKDVETLAKRYQKESRAYREKSHRFQAEAHDKIAYRSFKENDLALFLPTRNQATRPWAAFNVGAPHYFLREQDAHKLQSRDWLLARISKIEERIVDLSRSLGGGPARLSDSTQAEASETTSMEDENPFELSDGLRWYMIDAAEERPGAPGTPSVGKSTVIASTVEVKAHMGRKDKSGSGIANAVQATKHLNRSLESRRSSSASKRSLSIKKDSSSLKDASAPLAPIASSEAAGRGESPMVAPASEEENMQRARADDSVFDVGRSDRETVHASPKKSPKKSPTTSPQKGVSSPAKTKAWEQLFSVEYQA